MITFFSNNANHANCILEDHTIQLLSFLVKNESIIQSFNKLLENSILNSCCL